MEFYYDDETGILDELSEAPRFQVEPWWPLPTEGWGDKRPSEAPPKGTFFDEGVNFFDTAGAALTAEVVKLIPKQTGRGRRPNGGRSNLLVRAILANGLRCSYHFVNPLVAYSRRPSQYSDGPMRISGRELGRTVDALDRLGLVCRNKGRRHRTSTYGVTAKLLDIASQCGVSPKSLVCRVPPARLLRLYGPKPKQKPWARRPKAELLDFDPDHQTERRTAQLEAINGFIGKQEIACPISVEAEARWAESLNADEEYIGEQLRKPDLTQLDLYCVFNNGSFEQGGRLYGGWWINAPKGCRTQITIDGQPTVELDYKCYHINMLYHERNSECDGDAYELPEIVEYEHAQGLEPGSFRDCIKQYTNALINCGKGGHPHRIQLKNDTLFPDAYEPIDVIRMIERKHKPIKSAFRTGTGLRLQRIDSDIAVEVVTAAMNDGWLALPVHDSFIAKSENKTQLRRIMSDCYFKYFGYNINIERNNRLQ